MRLRKTYERQTVDSADQSHALESRLIARATMTGDASRETSPLQTVPLTELRFRKLLFATDREIRGRQFELLDDPCKEFRSHHLVVAATVSLADIELIRVETLVD